MEEDKEHKVNTKNIPALVMLLAGAVASITMILTGSNTKHFLITLLIVLIIFYIAGSIIKVVFDKSFEALTPKREIQEGGELGLEEDGAAEDLSEDRESYVVEERNNE